MLRQKGPRPILKTKHPNNRGNRPYRPTPEQRGTVEALAAYGIAQEDISQHLGITTKTLERHFAIERSDDRHHIGNASLHEIDWVSRTALFGMFIGEPSAWNRGFGRDAVTALVRFAFDEMNLRKLRINVFEYNERARHLLESIGFVQEGRLAGEFYRGGAYHDIVILSIFADRPQVEGATT